MITDGGQAISGKHGGVGDAAMGRRATVVFRLDCLEMRGLCFLYADFCSDIIAPLFDLSRQGVMSMSVLNALFIAAIAGTLLVACSSAERRAHRSRAERQQEPG